MNTKNLIIAALICLTVATQPLQSRSFLKAMTTNHRTKTANGNFELSLADRYDIADTKASTYAVGGFFGLFGPAAYLLGKKLFSKQPLTRNNKIGVYTALGIGFASFIKFCQVDTEARNLKTMVNRQNDAHTFATVQGMVTHGPEGKFTPTTTAAGWQLVRDLRNFNNANKQPDYYVNIELAHRIINIVNEYQLSESHKALNRAATGERLADLGPILLNLDTFLANEKTQIVLALYDIINDMYDNLDPAQEDANQDAQNLFKFIKLYVVKIKIIHRLYKVIDKNHPLFHHE